MITGLKVLAAIVLTPLVVLIVGIAGCEGAKSYYDWRVRELCAKDGGVVVYERMTLDRLTFERMNGRISGVPLVPPEYKNDKDIPVYSRVNDEVLREGTPTIARTEVSVIRRSDHKVLGKAVFYGRRGGDFPFTVSHPSSFGCPAKVELERSIFMVEGER